MRWTGWKKNLNKSSDPIGRRSLVDFGDKKINISRQAELLSVNRSSLYRDPPKEKTISEEDLCIMRRIDEIKIRRMMRDMGVYTIYPKPNLSKRYHAQYIRPYLLRNLDITHPDQVWGIDITYIRMKRGFLYLFVIIDWYSRRIIDYELSTTLEKEFVLSCLKRAFTKRKPEIINSDQGGHFTNPEYINLLEEMGIKISMDGKGQALDKVRTERFFRTLKYDLIYINEFDSPQELRRSLNKYMNEYNSYRPHSSIDGRCPDEAYYEDYRVVA